MKTFLRFILVVIFVCLASFVVYAALVDPNFKREKEAERFENQVKKPEEITIMKREKSEYFNLNSNMESLKSSPFAGLDAVFMILPDEKNKRTMLMKHALKSVDIDQNIHQVVPADKELQYQKEIKNWGETGNIDKALGCFLSHLNLWKFIVRNKLSSIMILEDDIDFGVNIVSQINDTYKNLNSSWPGLLAAGHCWTSFGYVKGILASPTSFACTHSYIITYEAAIVLLREYEKLKYDQFAPVDLFMVQVGVHDKKFDFKVLREVLFRQLPRSFINDANISGKCELPYKYLEHPVILADNDYKRYLGLN